MFRKRCLRFLLKLLTASRRRSPDKWLKVLVCAWPPVPLPLWVMSVSTAHASQWEDFPLLFKAALMTHSLSLTLFLIPSLCYSLRLRGLFFVLPMEKRLKKKKGGGVAFKSDMTKLQRCKCLTTGRWLDALQWSQKCVFSPHAPYCKVWWRLNHGSC